MKILIEVEGGCVTNVWCSDPINAQVTIRDLDEITEYDRCEDPLDGNEPLQALRCEQNQAI